jgi:hypothetical protein
LARRRSSSFSVVRTFRARASAVGGLLVLVAVDAHVVELAAQFRVLLAQRDLAGGGRVLRLYAGVEQVLEVGVLVGEGVPLDACLGGQRHDGELAV